jgi:hypothetical protein
MNDKETADFLASEASKLEAQIKNLTEQAQGLRQKEQEIRGNFADSGSKKTPVSSKFIIAPAGPKPRTNRRDRSLPG